MAREDDKWILNEMLREWRKTNEALEDIHQDLKLIHNDMVVIHQDLQAVDKDLQAIDGELQQPLPAVTGKIFLGKPVSQ